MRTEERIKLTEGGELLIFQVGEGGWQVWLDQKNDFDGVYLASGPDHATAINLAVEFLLGGVRNLRALLPDAGEVQRHAGVVNDR